MNTVSIYNPNDVPFGKLSNNSLDLLNIDGEIWGTVTNYMLANVLVTPLYRNIVHNSPIWPLKKNTNLEDKVRQLLTNAEQREGRSLTSEEIDHIKERAAREVGMANMNLYQVFRFLRNEEEIHTIRTSVEKAYTTLIDQSYAFREALLLTEDKPIECNGNETLGTQDGIGLNIIGITLMQVRDRLKKIQRNELNEIEKKKLEDEIFIIHTADTILQTSEKVSSYKGLSADRIIEKFNRKYPGQLLNLSPIEEVMKRYRRGMYPSYDKERIEPGGLFKYYLKNEGLRIIEKINLNKRRLVADKYIDYILDKKYAGLTDKEKEDAKGELFRQMDREKPGEALRMYRNMADRLYNLFKLGMLSSSISDTMDRDLDPLRDEEDRIEKILDEMNTKEEDGEDIAQIEESSEEEKDPLKNMLEEGSKNKKKAMIRKLSKLTGKSKKIYKSWDIEELEKALKENGITDLTPIEGYVKNLGNVFNIDMTVNYHKDLLDPFTPQKFNVDGLVYPSVMMFIVISLIAKTGMVLDKKLIDKGYKQGMGMSSAYRTGIIENKGTAVLFTASNNAKPEGKFFPLLEMPPVKAINYYIEIRDNTLVDVLMANVKKAMRKKFTNRGLQDLLLLTSNKELIWNDENTPEVSHLISNFFMELRNEINEARVPEFNPIIRNEHIPSIIFNDDFLRNWLQMRLSDMCSTVGKLKKYLKDKAGLDESIDDKFVRIAIDKFYQPCGYFSSLSSELNIPVPEYFISMVKECSGMEFVPSVNYADSIIRITEEEEEAEKSFYASKSVTRTKEEIKEFEDRQMREWLQLKKDVLAPRENRAKIPYLKYLIKQTTDKAKKKEIHNQIAAIDRSYYSLSNKTIKDAFDSFKEKKAAERSAFFGGDMKEISVEDKNEHIKRMEDFKERRKSLGGMEKKEIVHYEKIVTDVAQMYWDRIVVMIYFLSKITNVRNIFKTDMLNSDNIFNIKLAIAHTEMYNVKKIPCKTITGDEENDCILRALINLLKSVEMFKYEYAENIPVTEDDVDLALSILLNKDLKSKKSGKKANPFEKKAEKLEDMYTDSDLKTKKKKRSFKRPVIRLGKIYTEKDEDEPVNNVLDDVDEPADDDREEDIITPEEVLLDDEDDLPPEAMDEYDYENDPSNEDYGEVDVQRAQFKFGSESSAIKKVLKNIGFKNINASLIASYLSKTVQKVKAFHMSKEIKLNRINFFASS